MEQHQSVAIGGDHAGFELKEWLLNQGFPSVEFVDSGCHSADSVDYPDFAHLVASSVSTGKSSLGILICGSANGVAMTANKYQNIRAAICWTSEIATLARAHNDANILCLPARFITKDVAKEIVEAFLSEPFEGGRHQRRVAKMGDIKC